MYWKILRNKKKKTFVYFLLLILEIKVMSRNIWECNLFLIYSFEKLIFHANFNQYRETKFLHRFRLSRWRIRITSSIISVCCSFYEKRFSFFHNFPILVISGYQHKEDFLYWFVVGVTFYRASLLLYLCNANRHGQSFLLHP